VAESTEVETTGEKPGRSMLPRKKKTQLPLESIESARTRPPSAAQAKIPHDAVRILDIVNLLFNLSADRPHDDPQRAGSLLTLATQRRRKTLGPLSVTTRQKQLSN
jgi:hypothetical protein